METQNKENDKPETYLEVGDIVIQSKDEGLEYCAGILINLLKNEDTKQYLGVYEQQKKVKNTSYMN